MPDVQLTLTIEQAEEIQQLMDAAILEFGYNPGDRELCTIVDAAIKKAREGS